MERRASPVLIGSSDPALAETCAVPSISPGDTLPSNTPVTRSQAETIERAPDNAYAPITSDEEPAAIRSSVSPPALEGGRYEDGPLLGIGGMGEVRLARDQRIGRAVARKTLRAGVTGERALRRFVREARVQGQLEHPAVVPVYDLGVDELGRPFFTMKRVVGHTLASILNGLAKGDEAIEARYSQRKLLGAFENACLAIELAHKRGVIHRDLKPENLMLGDFGEVYVLDWGLAKLANEDENASTSGERPLSLPPPSKMTRDGDVVGTPLYMSPEQLRGERTLDARTDVFALGAILFEILTLTPFRRADSLEEITRGATDRNKRVDRPSERASGVPPELDALCVRALAPSPADRPASALEIAEAVGRHLEGDRDLAARKALSASLLESAEARLADGTPNARVDAMRDALKALALTPDDVAVQRLLLSVVVDGSGTLPADAEAEFANGDVEVRRQGTRFGIYGYLSWLACLPLAIWAGVRDARLPIALTTLTVACIVCAVLALRRGASGKWYSIVLAALSGATISLVSGWLGPFVLVPLAACASAVMFVIHCTKDERPYLITIWVLSTLLPFVVEALSMTTPAYTFRPGELVLHARALELPPTTTIVMLAYTSVSFMLLLLVFVGRLRDKQRKAERSLFVQAWHLRQLFPTAGDPGPGSRTTLPEAS